jgi:Subtilase family
MVFEVRGSISAFATAVRKVPGLELIDEEELEADEEDKAPVAYLMVPDVRALRDLESLWKRWLEDRLAYGETPWRDVFATLRDLRPWGPEDRVQPEEVDILCDVIVGLDDEAPVRLEIELIYRAAADVGAAREGELRAAVAAQRGRIVSASRIEDVAYHALLVDLPVLAVRQIIARSPDGIAGLEPIMHIRPQSIASMIDIAEAAAFEVPAAVGALGEPILALLDGVPVAAHPLLSAHLVVDDQFGLEPNTPVTDRIHGTAMASLVVHGDRNRAEPPLSRRIHVVPVLGARDGFPPDRLIIDVIYNAVLAMKDGPRATAPDVLIVNLSLGNPRRVFHGQMSAWARLLDRLAYRFGLLFIVSAGNYNEQFAIQAFANHEQYENADPNHRAGETLRALGAIVRNRRLFSPAETVNGVTVGACNVDAVSDADRAMAGVNVDPYGDLQMSNPSSALGPGFALSVKPDLLMPGARERLQFRKNDAHIEVRPAGPARGAGLRVAAPPRGGQENLDGFTNGTSAAAALASRTAHRIHDALEAAYGDTFRQLNDIQRAVLLKALLAHPARWPSETAALIRNIIGPLDGRLHVRQKDNIRRFFGYGVVDADDAVACADDRATFWATGLLQSDKIATVSVPVPAAMGGQARPHSVSATLAWFTPTSPGRKSYRSVRLKLLEPNELVPLGVKAHSDQPDGNQIRRGTLFTRCWSGDRAPVVGADMSIQLTIQRDPDQGIVIDDSIPFGLAVTLTMPGVVAIYEQVRQRLGIKPRAPA